LIEGIGPITTLDLFALPEGRLGQLRISITHCRHGKMGLVTRCMACQDEVYIRTAHPRGTSRPLFALSSGSDPDCSWRHGRRILTGRVLRSLPKREALMARWCR